MYIVIVNPENGQASFKTLPDQPLHPHSTQSHSLFLLVHQQAHHREGLWRINTMARIKNGSSSSRVRNGHRKSKEGPRGDGGDSVASKRQRLPQPEDSDEESLEAKVAKIRVSTCPIEDAFLDTEFAVFLIPALFAPFQKTTEQEPSFQRPR